MASAQSKNVRVNSSLNANEKTFIDERRKRVLQSIEKLNIGCSQDDVPNIALLGSGGGQRAMVALLGSLAQLGEAGLLDCVLYLSGVSGSTWCMASLYQEPDWSSKLETVKEKIVQRLGGPGISGGEASAKLKKYYYEKDIFSLTDFWAAMAVTTYVKEINEQTLSDQWREDSKDPYPIYTVIDKGCKQEEEGDPWVEITPHEAGYSLAGVFVDTSHFGSQFHEGSKKKHQPQIDMLYLQALCGSAIADEKENKAYMWETLKDWFSFSTRRIKARSAEDAEDLTPEEKCNKVLMDLVDMNLLVLDGNDPRDLQNKMRRELEDLSGGEVLLMGPRGGRSAEDETDADDNIKQYNSDVLNSLSSWFDPWPYNLFGSMCKCINKWTWGRKFGFLHNMKDEAVPSALQKTETRDFIDAGLLNNSPYMSVLREERHIDLIISLDFSDGDPFLTVKEASKSCKKLNIPFPEVNIADEEAKKPQDFYVFRSQGEGPTVIHIPLFNVVNCGDKLEKWRTDYSTFQRAYSAKMISDLVEVAGKNISNNIERLKEEISAAIGQKRSRH